MLTSIEFRSAKFQPQQNEDSETNPYRYGKALAVWILEKLPTSKYPDAQVFAEDWGWLILCQREPFTLSIGCGNQEQTDDKGNWIPPDPDSIVWECFVDSKVPFLKRIFSKIDSDAAEKELDAWLRGILQNDTEIHLLKTD